eukprot:COSAG02_NODE_1842_length_10700_cov_148.785869_5_plen_631_part_00
MHGKLRPSQSKIAVVPPVSYRAQLKGSDDGGAAVILQGSVRMVANMALWLLVAILSHTFILVVEAQFDPSGGFTSACPYTGSRAFPDRMRALNAACCVPSGDGSGAECAGTCHAECIAVLFPLMDDCHDVINEIYDGADGTQDGDAAMFTSIYAECMRVQPEDLIGMLETLQDQGKCPQTVLDGIGATEVQDATCTDVWTGERCEMSIASGVFQCATDFCNTVPTQSAPCVVAGQCDRTCRFCGEDGHRRLELMLAKLEEHRRLQLGNVQCDPATFAAEASSVQTACCDDDGSSCANGVPTTCDAKCAVAFNGFFTRCNHFMTAQFSLDEMGHYDRLYSTCTESLPNEPLLRALVVCSQRAPDPCWGVDCGGHGTCRSGACQCHDGYSGRQCQQAPDPCLGVDCGGHGTCRSGACQCHDGYSGRQCNHFATQELSTHWEDTGYDSTGDIVYMDRHDIACPTGQVLQRWKYALGAASQTGSHHQNGAETSNAGRFEYTCMTVPGGLHSCSSHDTGWNELGDPRTQLVYLDRHALICPVNAPAMTQWKIHHQGDWTSFRVDYTCCRTSTAPVCDYATSAQVSDNNGRITTDGLVFTATRYMQTCPEDWFMSRWQLQRESGHVGIVYGCCTFR